MKLRSRVVLLAGLMPWMVACGEPEPVRSPVERRVEPVRSQTATADSLTREHERRVQEMVDEAR
jgi:hypothetical protein